MLGIDTYKKSAAFLVSVYRWTYSRINFVRFLTPMSTCEMKSVHSFHTAQKATMLWVFRMRPDGLISCKNMDRFMLVNMLVNMLANMLAFTRTKVSSHCLCSGFLDCRSLFLFFVTASKTPPPRTLTVGKSMTPTWGIQWHWLIHWQVTDINQLFPDGWTDTLLPRKPVLCSVQMDAVLALLINLRRIRFIPETSWQNHIDYQDTTVKSTTASLFDLKSLSNAEVGSAFNCFSVYSA